MKKLVACCLLSLLLQPIFAQKKSPKKDFLVTISTDLGTMYAVLYDQTPQHKANFIKLAKEGFYNGTLFHRIIDGFMIQGGDPTSKTAPEGQPLGSGDVGYKVPAEINEKLFHKKGVIAAARDNNPEKASSGSQFYIAQGKVYQTDDEIAVAARRAGRPIAEDQKQVYKTIGGIPHLDGNYTVYGEVIKGIEVIDAIAKQPRGEGDRPVKNIPMKVEVKPMKKKKITKMYGYRFG